VGGETFKSKYKIETLGLNQSVLINEKNFVIYFFNFTNVCQQF